jgi:TonB family protein
MNAFANYLIEANLGICFFMLVYLLGLNQETEFQFKRVYLLLSLLISITIPFFHWNWFPALPFDHLPAYWLPEIHVTSTPEAEPGLLSIRVIVFTVYALGAAACLILFIFRLFKTFTLIYKSPSKDKGSVWIIEPAHNAEVFSFFKFIFIGQMTCLTENERRQVILHESTHVRHLHSLDILFVNVLNVFFWFNPLIKTYRQSLVQLHEFEADARSVETYEVDEYCSLLAKAALYSSGYQLANHFTSSLTLKRIKMMKTSKTKIGGWRIFFIAGIALAFCYLIIGNDFVFAQAKKEQKTTGEVFDQVDEMPTYGKGINDLYGYIKTNLLYPEEARKSKIEGTVYSEFVVELDGSLSHVRVTKGIGHGCDEEVLRVMKSLPKWRPGEKDGKAVRTKMVLPIVFKI